MHVSFCAAIQTNNSALADVGNMIDKCTSLKYRLDFYSEVGNYLDSSVWFWYDAVLPFFMLQLQEQLDSVSSILDHCTPHLKLRLVEVQQEVVERWEELRGHADRRGEELKLACQRYLFLNTVKTDRWMKDGWIKHGK